VAAKTLHIPGFGNFKYDDDSGAELLSAGRIQSEHVPSAGDDTLRKDDLVNMGDGGRPFIRYSFMLS